MVNFVSLVGGGFGSEREHRTDVVYGVGEFADMFDLSRVSTHSCQIEFHRLGEVSRKVLQYCSVKLTSVTILLTVWSVQKGICS